LKFAPPAAITRRYGVVDEQSSRHGVAAVGWGGVVALIRIVAPST
jgi:hypothetical protein